MVGCLKKDRVTKHRFSGHRSFSMKETIDEHPEPWDDGRRIRCIFSQWRQEEDTVHLAKRFIIVIFLFSHLVFHARLMLPVYPTDAIVVTIMIYFP